MRFSALLFSAFLLWTCVSALTAADAAPKIAVLRLEEVLSQHKAYNQGIEQLKQMKADSDRLLAGYDEQKKKLEGQLQALKPDSEMYGNLVEKYELLKTQRDVSLKRAEGTLDGRFIDLIERSYAQVRVSLQRFCQERGIMLVNLASEPNLNIPSRKDIGIALGLKSVLYYDPSLDITKSFIEYLSTEKPEEKPAEKAAEPAAKAPAETPKPITP